jgi:superfamily II DNA/RNA helicase
MGKRIRLSDAGLLRCFNLEKSILMTTLTHFDTLNLPAKMMTALKNMNYQTPTAIQAQAIPFALQGRDILGSARTGTGKTAAFSIPMIERLMRDDQSMALVLAPTRELAAQTLDVVHKLTQNNRDLGTALLIGGDSMGKQFEQLRRNPRIIIGTPGRINDHLRRNPKLLSRVVYVAVDEADRMLDMGFSEQIDDIFKTIPKERQMLMFSATFPESIIKFSRKYLNNPERVSVGEAKADAPKINHDIKRTSDNDKYTDLVAELVARDGSVIIFVKTQHGTEHLAKRLDADDHASVVIHGGLRQNQRERAVRAFRNQRARIMVATDVAARGLDIPHIEHVINYDLPQVPEDYIHRIGRTGRAGASGNAIAFVTPSDVGKWNAINRILNPGSESIRAERSATGQRYNGPRGNGSRQKSFDKPYEKRSWSKGRSEGYEGRERSYQDRDRDGYRPVKPSYAGNNDQGRDYNRQTDRQSNRHSDRQGGYQKRSEGGRSERSYAERPYEGRQPENRSRDYSARGGQHLQGRRDGARADGARSDRPFVKYEGSRRPTDRNWNIKEDRGTYTHPKEYKPDWREQGRGNGRMDNVISDKPKKAKPEVAKKPFKFKEHSRKPARSQGRPGEKRAAQ